MTTAALLVLTVAVILAAVAFIALCRISRMDDSNIRQTVRLAYALVFAGSLTGAGIFGGILAFNLAYGSVFGGEFARSWVAWLGAWMLLYSAGQLALLLTTAPAWRGGIPEHARPAPRPEKSPAADGIRRPFAA